MIDNCKDCVLYSDFDATFRGKDNAGVEKNIEAVKKFNALGGMFAFATGRGYCKEFFDLAPYFAEISTAPLIHYNGALVYNHIKDLALYDVMLDSAIIIPYLLKTFKEYGSLEFHLYSSAKEYVYVGKYDEVKKFISSDKCTKYWMKGCIYGDVQTLDIIKNELTIDFTDIISFTFSGPHCLEFMSGGISKGSGIEISREYFKSIGTPKKIFAIGDYENDISMLKAADYSATPENACDNAKAVSDITVCHCNNGAVADFIERIIDGSIFNKKQLFTV